MAVPAQTSVRNRLLAILPPVDFSLLGPRLACVPLPVGTRLAEPNTPIEHVYFLEEGIASVVAAPLRADALRRGSSDGTV